MGARRVNTGADKKKKSSALGETLIVCPNECNFYCGQVIYTGAGTPWLQLHDSATVPSVGAVPISSRQVQATSDAYIEYVNSIPMLNGIVLVLSSTQDTYTALGANAGIFLGTFH